MENEEPQMTAEEIMSAFVTLAAEGDLMAQRAFYTAAIESYTRALLLRQNDKNVLVSRSRCHLLIGDAHASLQDAQLALSLDATFFKALFQKAEALYAMGDFEAALMFYHRGNRLRPELEEFRIGIQKSREAIENSIGDPAVRISIQPELKKTVLQLFSNTQHQHQQVGITESLNITHAIASNKVTTKSSVRDMPQTPNVIAAVNPSNPASVNAFLSHRGITPPPTSTLTPAMETKLLGDLYEDKAYLSQLLSDRDLLEHPNDQVLRLVADGLRYFDTRIDFWRQQNPLYARHAHSRQAHTRQKQKAAARKTPVASGRGNGKPVVLPPIALPSRRASKVV